MCDIFTAEKGTPCKSLSPFSDLTWFPLFFSLSYFHWLQCMNVHVRWTHKSAPFQLQFLAIMYFVTNESFPMTWSFVCIRWNGWTSFAAPTALALTPMSRHHGHASTSLFDQAQSISTVKVYQRTNSFYCVCLMFAMYWQKKLSFVDIINLPWADLLKFSLSVSFCIYVLDFKCRSEPTQNHFGNKVVSMTIDPKDGATYRNK